MAVRLMIVDDHALFRQGLKSLLMLQPNIVVVGEVDRASALDDALAATPCDIILLDLQMERWLMDEIPSLSKRAAVIVLTATESAASGVKALRLGARGLVHKRFAIETLMTAIEAVAEGLVWMPPIVQAEFAAEGGPAARQLTTREAEIVRCVASGMRNGEVATQLSISESTVKTHLNNIFQKLALRDRMELTHYAISSGLVAVQNRDR
ncbi:MAG TPA: response regulator transcription factor [Candidatus Binataceae bacterium]|nr:response regulator transcription factor [Candidatus Binataceae bacterium]